MGPETLSSFQTNGAALAAQLAIIGGAICYAVNTLLAERYAVADGLIAAAGTTIAANVILLPLTLHDLGGGLSGLTVSSGLAVLALGVISTGLAPVLYLRLIRATGPTYVSLISYLIPAWAVLLGVVFLGETLGWSALIAMGLILGGIALSQRAPVASGDLNPDKSAGMDRTSGSIKQNRRGVPSERDHDDRRGRNVHI
jgi:drug/metabolite transporter (DMT)-like permease